MNGKFHLQKLMQVRRRRPGPPSYREVVGGDKTPLIIQIVSGGDHLLAAFWRLMTDGYRRTLLCRAEAIKGSTGSMQKALAFYVLEHGRPH